MNCTHYSATCLTWYLLSAIALAQTNPASPATQRIDFAVQTMFDQFSDRMGPMGPMFGKMTPEQLRRIENISVSPNEERVFGKRILDGYLEQLERAHISVSTQGPDINYLQELSHAIRPSMTKAKRYPSLDIRIVESNVSDAVSIPGGHLLFTRGLLDNSESEAALVGVLAHELSHLERGHQLTTIKQSKMTQQPLNFSDSMLWVSLIARPFRPEQETEADMDATRWMMAAGYQPQQLAKLLLRWDQQQNATTPWMQFVPGFVKSHPDPGKRSREILETAARHNAQFPNSNYVGIENLRLRIPKSKREFN